jgi:predicted RNA-binding Zn ribbon-like protein
MGVLPPDFQDTSAAAGQSIVPALETRSLIFRLLMPVIGSEAPAESDLASFQARLEEVSAEMKFVSTTGGYGLVCGAADPVEQILCAVVRSAADLFLSNQLEKVKQCKGCGWLFYDISRNHSRRWCNMKVCGNRAKARRHYARVRQKQAESEIASRKSLAR